MHKIANVLDSVPKRLRARVKECLHDMMYAEKKEDAEKERRKFEKTFEGKYPKAVEKINKDWEELTTFFNYPAYHWKHLRTTNPIESSFATVKHRTRQMKGAGSVEMAQAMAFKLLLEMEKRWRILNKPGLLYKLQAGVAFKDGVMVEEMEKEATTA